jgi:hypothetical protein
VNDLRELRKGRGYWLNATQPMIARFKGDSATSALSAFGPLSLPPATYYGLAPRAGLRVEARVNGNLCGQAQTEMYPLGGRQQAVFVIDVGAAGTEAGCGTSGQPVTITMLDSARAVVTRITSWDNSRTHRLEAEKAQIYLPAVAR